MLISSNLELILIDPLGIVRVTVLGLIFHYIFGGSVDSSAEGTLFKPQYWLRGGVHRQ